jgi:hypothetical protein
MNVQLILSVVIAYVIVLFLLFCLFASADGSDND